jgi:DNA-binding MarR family transcriptional regulator
MSVNQPEVQTLDSAVQLESLLEAVREFLGAERRLRARDIRHGGALTNSQIRALFALTADAEMSVGKLAKLAGLNPATVTTMVDNLEQAGLVQRRRGSEDRRMCFVALTEAGRVEVSLKSAEWRQKVEQALADLTGGDIEGAAAVLHRLAAVFDSY